MPTPKRGRGDRGRDIERAVRALKAAGQLPAHGKPMAVAAWLAHDKPTIWATKSPNRRIIFYNGARLDYEQFSRHVRDICRSARS
jgi:hypothetical protein